MLGKRAMEHAVGGEAVYKPVMNDEHYLFELGLSGNIGSNEWKQRYGQKMAASNV